MIIGYCYLVADILHKGHLQHIRNCRAMCDYLIAGILTDEATMEKKPKPIIGFSERIDIVNELRVVDAVVAQETYSPLDNINAIKPDILFESTSHKEPIINPYGRTVVMPYYPDQSSTKIKDKINGRFKQK